MRQVKVIIAIQNRTLGSQPPR